MTFIGSPKTFHENDVKSETYILDFGENIYNKEVEVKLLEKIRENEKFKSVEKLIEQIKIDVEKTREYFRKLT